MSQSLQVVALGSVSYRQKGRMSDFLGLLFNWSLINAGRSWQNPKILCGYVGRKKKKRSVNPCFSPRFLMSSYQSKKRVDLFFFFFF